MKKKIDKKEFLIKQIIRLPFRLLGFIFYCSISIIIIGIIALLAWILVDKFSFKELITIKHIFEIPDNIKWWKL